MVVESSLSNEAVGHDVGCNGSKHLVWASSACLVINEPRT